MTKVFPAWAWKPYHWVRTRLTRPELLYLETHLTDHCNLNCKGCGHFSPISDAWLADLAQHRNDMQRLAKLFRNVKKVRLMGGEPLLHPRVSEFLGVTRCCLPTSDIRLVTNGILLAKMNDDFWAACRENRITIDMTVYPPLAGRAPQCIQLAQSHGVPIECTETGKFDARLNLKGDSDPVKSFQTCIRHYGCFFLRQGHLYCCAFAPLATYFNKRFGAHIDTSGGIDLYKPGITGWKVLQALYKPIPGCRFCTEESRSYDWATTAYCRQEWETSSYLPNKGSA